MNPGQMVYALAQALYGSLWQGLAVGVLAAVLTAVVRAPRARYLVAAAALAALPLLFFWTAVAAYRDGDAFAVVEVASLPAVALPWQAWLVALWAAGALAMGLRTGAGWLLLRRIVARAEAAPELQRVVDRVAAHLGVGARVRAAFHDGAEGPMVIGWLEPVLVMPFAAMTRLDAAQLEAVVAHELWHVRRFDFLVNLVQSLVVAMFFFHPAAWWLSRKMRAWREECCDDAAVDFSGDPLRYARALTELESARSAAPAVAIAGDGSLRQRIERLVRPERPRRRFVGVAFVATLVAGLSAAVVAACVGEADELDQSSVEAGIHGAAAPGQNPEHPCDIPWLPPSVARFEPLFLDAARRHGVDPEMLAIVTLVESGGWAEARSKSGARGLMQIMPATGETIAKERGLSDHDADKLSDPAYNIDFGAYYLARQLQRFATEDADDSVERAAAAYNGGPNRLERHLAGEADLSDETTRYKRWVRNMWAERDASASATLKEWLDAGGSRLVARGADEMQ
jgi:beta-lactamase regulating signal transducer with metallopeptidase domain